MVDISKETCEKYWVELIVDRDEILWLQFACNYIKISFKLMFEVIELIHIFMNVKSQQKLMETVIVTEILTMKQEKAIEQELDCEFIRIDPNKKHFDIFEAIN